MMDANRRRRRIGTCHMAGADIAVGNDDWRKEVRRRECALHGGLGRAISERRRQLTMNENTQRTSARNRSRNCCHYCGMSVNLEQEDTVMDALGGGSPQHKSGIQVWHRRCFDDFLDEGEET